MLAKPTAKTMEILLVEDGLLDARITIHALRRSRIRHRMTLLRSVQEARRFLSREGVYARAPRPDLLLLDLTLPDGDGVSILNDLSELQADAEQTSPVVILTACDDQETRQRCESLGVDDYINKPVDEDKFLRVVRDHEQLMRFSETEPQVATAMG